MKLPKTMPPGIWYEYNRRRFRVRVYAGDRVVHLSYHTKYQHALRVWKAVTKEAPGRYEGIAEALYKDARVPANTITVNGFIHKYFNDPDAPYGNTSVLRWIRTGMLPAVRAGGRYRIDREAAERFVQEAKHGVSLFA